MNNRNMGRDEGGSWMPTLSLAAAAGVGAAVLCWKIHESTKKNKEMELKIRRLKVYIEQNRGIDNYESISNAKQINFFKGSIVINRLMLHALCKVDEVEDLLVERQHVLCSYFKTQSYRSQLEDQIREKASEYDDLHPDMKVGLEKVLSEDRHCASCLTYLWTGDKRRNGDLMWAYLQDCRTRINTAAEAGLQKNLIKDPPWKKIFKDNFSRTESISNR